MNAATETESLFFLPQAFLRVRAPSELDFFQCMFAGDLTQQRFISLRLPDVPMEQIIKASS